jgi:WASH complex subunit 7
MRAFLDEYSQQLREIEEALHESLSDVWDATVDPVALSIAPYEQSSILELLNTENKLFNKVMLVFASLCSEASQLISIVCVVLG